MYIKIYDSTSVQPCIIIENAGFLSIPVKYRDFTKTSWKIGSNMVAIYGLHSPLNVMEAELISG